MTTDNLQTHITGVLVALHGYLSTNDVLKHRAAHIRRPTSDPADLRRWAHEYGPIAIPAVAEWYEPLQLHVSAISDLTKDANLRTIVRKLRVLAGIEVDNQRKIIAQAQSASEATDGGKLVGKILRMAFGAVLRKRQIKSGMAELEMFYPPAA